MSGRSCPSPAITGTGTDCIVVAAPCEGEPVYESSGPKPSRITAAAATISRPRPMRLSAMFGCGSSAAEAWFATARRAAQARHSLFDAGAGLSEPGAAASEQERRRIVARRLWKFGDESVAPHDPAQAAVQGHSRRGLAKLLARGTRDRRRWPLPRRMSICSAPWRSSSGPFRPLA